MDRDDHYGYPCYPGDRAYPWSSPAVSRRRPEGRYDSVSDAMLRLTERRLESARAQVEILSAALMEIAETKEDRQELRWYRERAERALVGAGLRMPPEE